MNSIEKHGNKIAAALCVASCIPVGYAIYAAETEDGKALYANTEQAIGMNAEEIVGGAYYIDETRSASKETTHKAAESASTEDTETSETIEVSSESKRIAAQVLAQIEEDKIVPASEAAIAAGANVEVYGSADASVSVYTENTDTANTEAPATADSALENVVAAVYTEDTAEAAAPAEDEAVSGVYANTSAEEAAPAVVSEPEVIDNITTDTAPDTTYEAETPAISEEVTEPAEVYDTVKDPVTTVDTVIPAGEYTEDESNVGEDTPVIGEEAADSVVLVNSVGTTPTPQPVEEVQEPAADDVQEPVIEDVQEPVVEDVQTPAEDVETPAEDVQAPVVEEVEAPVEEVQEPEFNETEAPVVDDVVFDDADDTVVSDSTVSDDLSTLNAAIASAAQQLVGVTDGLQCTEVVTQALQAAGITDATELWPSEYADYYGYYTDTPEAGNLIYYDAGGNGYDHIAIYIGGDQAVHGNFITEDGTSKTVVASIYCGSGNPQFIQVVQ